MPFFVLSMALSSISTLIKSPVSSKTSNAGRVFKKDLIESLLPTGPSSSLNAVPLSPDIISNLAKLDLKKNSLTKTAHEVLDGDNLVHQAASGLRQQKVTLERIEDLVKEAKNSTISAGRRQEIAQAIEKQVKELNKRADTVRYGKTKVLSGESGPYEIKLGEKLGNETISIQLTKATGESLDIESLDVSSVDKAKESETKIQKAIETVEAGHDLLVNASQELSDAADVLQKELSNILTIQEVFGEDQAVSIAESLQTANLKKSHTTNSILLANINSLL